MYRSTLSLTSVLDGGKWSTPRPACFIPGKETRYPVYRRLGGPEGRSGRVRKILPRPGLDPRSVQPLASPGPQTTHTLPMQYACVKRRQTLS
jgi:hypothetical protein